MMLDNVISETTIGVVAIGAGCYILQLINSNYKIYRTEIRGDIKNLENKMATKTDINRLEKDVHIIQSDIKKLIARDSKSD